MASKTISLSIRAYERLRNARQHPNESFSQVVMRAAWPQQTITAAELLENSQNLPPCFTDTELDAIDQAKKADNEPADKWNER